MLGDAEGGHEAVVSADDDSCDEVLDEGFQLVDVTGSDDLVDVSGDVVEGGRAGRGGLFGDEEVELDLAVAELLPLGAELGQPVVDLLVVAVELAVLERVEVAVDLRGDCGKFGVDGGEFVRAGVVVGVVVLLGGVDGLGDEVVPGAVELNRPGFGGGSDSPRG